MRTTVVVMILAATGLTLQAAAVAQETESVAREVAVSASLEEDSGTVEALAANEDSATSEEPDVSGTTEPSDAPTDAESSDPTIAPDEAVEPDDAGEDTEASGQSEEQNEAETEAADPEAIVDESAADSADMSEAETPAETECVEVRTSVEPADASRALEVICANCGTCCYGCQLDAGTRDWVSVGGALVESSGNRGSLDQYGTYPEGALTSGRLHTKDDYHAWDRIEGRWWDIHADGGRSWLRLTLWPVTLQSDSALISGRAWDSFGTEPALIPQEATLDDARLRFHRGEFVRMQLRYERFELNRDGGTLLDDLKVQRMDYRYNFKLGGIRTVGQLRQTGTAIDTAVPGSTGRINQTRLKLDSRLDDRLVAYTRLNFSAYEYDELPEREFAGADWTVGMRFEPEDCWLVTAELRTKDHPDSNTVSSHIRNAMEAGLAVNYGARGNSYEVGYKARKLDYARLDMQDPAVFSLLRQASSITPGHVGHAVDVLTPTYDQYWLDVKHNLTPDLRFTTRADFSGGDQPGSELTAAGSSSLLYDRQLSRTHGLSYALDCRNQLEVSVFGQETLNTERDSHVAQHYFEGSWLHRLDQRSSLMLAWRKTDLSLDAPTFQGGLYASDDVTYIATYGHNRRDMDYSLNLSLSEGSGPERYMQAGASAGIRFSDVPLGLRIDWYDRDYATFPGLNADGLTLAVDYKIGF